MQNIYIHRDRRAIALWLFVSALLVICMVALGGYTRLSGSGLSITEWKPIHGALPPMSDADWQEEFAGYKQSPQYIKVNNGMELEEFKTIFWPEYFHRLLARAVGMGFLIPFLIFAIRRSFTRPFAKRLMIIFILGGIQGLIGWLMVESGLVDAPNVSHYRLALHLTVGFAIYGLIVWSLLDVAASGQRPAASEKSLLTAGRWPLAAYFFWFILLIFQLILGAFMAGLHAGLIYNTWPTMDGQWIPDGLLYAKINPLNNIIFIQFMHRGVAAIVVLGFLFWWHRNHNYVKNMHLDKVCAGVAAVLALQFILGVSTLLHQAPLPLALAHQLTALLLFTLAVLLLHRLNYCHSRAGGDLCLRRDDKK